MKKPTEDQMLTAIAWLEAYDAKARELELIGAEIRALNEVKAALVQASAISDGYAEIHRSAAKRVP